MWDFWLWFCGSEEKRRSRPLTVAGSAAVQDEVRGAGVEVPEEEDVESWGGWGLDVEYMLCRLSLCVFFKGVW